MSDDAVTFRFRPATHAVERAAVLDRLRRCGAKKVEPLVAGSADDVVAGIFLAEGDGRRLLDALASEGAVEFAEAAPERRLIE